MTSKVAADQRICFVFQSYQVSISTNNVGVKYSKNFVEKWTPYYPQLAPKPVIGVNGQSYPWLSGLRRQLWAGY
jgi:hypothetical protein